MARRLTERLGLVVWTQVLYVRDSLDQLQHGWEARIATDDKRIHRSERSVRRILDAAATLFGTEGYMGASMNAVARAAGVSKGLLHYHFRSKEHLLIEAQRVAFRRIHSQFESSHSPATGREAALGAVDAMWHSIRDLYRWAPFLVETLSLSSTSKSVSTHLDQFYDESMALLEKGIDRVFADTPEALPMSSARLARLVRVSLHGLLVELALAQDDADLVRADETFADLRHLLSEFVITEDVSGQ